MVFTSCIHSKTLWWLYCLILLWTDSANLGIFSPRKRKYTLLIFIISNVLYIKILHLYFLLLSFYIWLFSLWLKHLVLLHTLLDFGYCSLGSSAAGSLLLSLREKLSPLLVPTSGFLMSSLLESGVLGHLGTLSPGYCALVLHTSSSFLMDVSLTLHACCSWLLRGFWKQLLVSGGMFLRIRMLATFLEDLGSVSSIHMVSS